LDVWDTHLAQHGAALLAARLELTAALAPHVAKAYDAVSAGRGDARIAYSPSWSTGPVVESEIEATLLAALREARPSEVERGVTLVGPHRDELSLTLGELPAKGYASHGESWSYALALRLAAYDLLRADGIEPVLVLDDVFAELDTGRRDRLAELVAPTSSASQVIVTCAVDADVPRSLRGPRYEVGGGEVRRVSAG
jgi:DNA replication and repair protein RecF